jgi:hypothetical protein
MFKKILIPLITLCAFTVGFTWTPYIAPFFLGSISETSNKVTYTGDSSTTEFSFTFSIVDTSDLVVILRTIATGAETVLTETSDYSVTATNNDFSSGGTVTTVSTYTSASTITIIRDTPLTQGTDLDDSGVLRLENIEDAFDKLTRIVQDHDETLGRCIKFPRSETNDPELVSSVSRTSLTFKFDSSGDISIE